MRRTLSLLVLISFSASWHADVCRAESDIESSPVRARIVTAGATLHSGPGEDFYVTDSLAEHAVVEIYRRQPDGWCAIRPPEESFSWVFANHLQSAGDGLAIINKEEVPARVGSHLSSRRNEVQVYLHQGEVVQVLDDVASADGQWLKIAPPSGEFRWIHAKDVVPLDAQQASWSPAATITTVSHEQNNAEAPPKEATNELSAPPLADDATSKWTAASDTNQSAQPQPPTDSDGSTESPTSVGPPEPTGDFADDLAVLELRLSATVAEPVETWDIDTLEQTAEQLLSQANTVTDRDAVKATLAKIDRFAAIQRRRLMIQGRGVQPSGQIAQQHAATGVPANVAATASSGSDVASPYDAVGVLRPVVSRRPGAPQFALVNDAGQVVSFLTPTPDLNLQTFLGRRIGVVGSRGYIPEFRRAHVTASRVTPLTTGTMVR